MVKLFEIEIQRTNITPAQFLGYLRQMQKKHPDMSSDFSLTYFKAGDDLNFDIRHEDGSREISVSKPYKMQTYIRGEDGSVFNEICEFDFYDDKTGFGYYYTVQTVKA